jgi:hypothetical protein
MWCWRLSKHISSIRLKRLKKKKKNKKKNKKERKKERKKKKRKEIIASVKNPITRRSEHITFRNQV